MNPSDKQTKIRAVLLALKMRIYLSFGFGYSTLFPSRDALLIRADKHARRHGMFIQRLPARIVILTAVGMFFCFLVSQNAVGLISVLYLMPPVIIPLAVLLGALTTARVDSIDVRLRREYARLSAGSVADLACSGWVAPRRSIDDRMRDRRVNRYRDTQKILRQMKRPRPIR